MKANTPTTLPIDSLESAVKEHLSKTTRPLVVVAPTGSGKSTRLPGWMANALSGKVLVIEPRRVACRSLARFLAEQKGEPIGKSIGYRVRFEDASSPQTQVLFVTPGVALRMMASGGIEDYAAVMLDEFHERSWETDLILALLVERFANLKWLITSATIDAERLARKYDGEVMHSLGRTFPVSLHHVQSRPAPTLDQLPDEVARVVQAVLNLEHSSAGSSFSPNLTPLESSNSTNQGRDILVFLPGKGEIGACRAACLPLQRKYPDLEIVSVHGGVPASELNAAFQLSRGGTRRVYLSTNVAETSVTLPGVGWVVDSGLVRMRIHRGGRAVLALVATSKASMEQRQGRAGRVLPGRCIRLFSQRYEPEPHPAPEMERMELDEVLLRAAAVGLIGEAFRNAAFPGEQKEFAYERAMDRLLGVGLVDQQGALTELGQAISKLPVSIEAARILVDAAPEIQGTLCDIVALMERGDRMVLPTYGIRNEKRLEDIIDNRKELLAGCRHEVDTLLRFLQDGNADNHALNKAVLKDTRKLSHLLRRLFQLPKDMGGRTSTEDLATVSRHLIKRVPEWVFVLRKRAEKKAASGKPSRNTGEPWGNGEEELLVDPFTPAFLADPASNPKAGIILSHTWLGAKRGTKINGVGRLLLPCSLKMLVEEDFGELVVKEPKTPKGGRGQDISKEGYLAQLDAWPQLRSITANQERTYAGRILDSSDQALTGKALRMALAQMIANRQWAPPLGLWLASELRAWFISYHWGKDLGYEAMGDPLPEPPDLVEPDQNSRGRAIKSDYPGVEKYILNKLETLGFEEVAEWGLLGPDDLKAPVDSLFHKKEMLLKDFPVRWMHQGALYRSMVFRSQRQIILEPMNQNASKAKEPAAEFVPRFRGFSVYYRKADRKIKLR